MADFVYNAAMCDEMIPRKPIRPDDPPAKEDSASRRGEIRTAKQVTLRVDVRATMKLQDVKEVVQVPRDLKQAPRIILQHHAFAVAALVHNELPQGALRAARCW